MSNTRPLYTTQGGGVCRYVNGVYIWIETPKDACFAEMQIGDAIPEEWGVAALNSAAVEEAEANR